MVKIKNSSWKRKLDLNFLKNDKYYCDIKEWTKKAERKGIQSLILSKGRGKVFYSSTWEGGGLGCISEEEIENLKCKIFTNHFKYLWLFGKIACFDHLISLNCSFLNYVKELVVWQCYNTFFEMGQG